ncbi:MAG: nucleotidyltransferase domain-containing protein [Bacteroidota bacterium]
MLDTIKNNIAQLEQQKNIKVLYACESGSRAWGIASPDSDYDVRFIYVHQLDWYLSLCNHKDTITIKDENTDLDMTGWDLRKTLQLMKKSNAAPLEWMQSPMVYHETGGFLRRFRKVGDTCFSPNALNYHYLSMAKKFYSTCAGAEPVKLKNWFYALRTALNARWIVENNEMPPTVFKDTLSLVDPSIKKEILALVALKGTKNEDFLFEKEASLLNLIQESITISEAHKSKLAGSKVNMREMDKFFQRMIPKPKKHDYHGAKKSTPFTV